MKFDWSPVQIAMRAATEMKSQPATACRQAGPTDGDARSSMPRVANPARTRRRVAMARVMSAACTACHGFGCVNCGETGLD